MLNGLSTSLKVILGLQLVLTLLFLTMGWSHTSSLTFGRSPSFADMVALTAPFLLVIAGALVAARAARHGQVGLASVYAIMPIPLAIVLAMLAGLV